MNIITERDPESTTRQKSFKEEIGATADMLPLKPVAAGGKTEAGEENSEAKRNGKEERERRACDAASKSFALL